MSDTERPEDPLDVLARIMRRWWPWAAGLFLVLAALGALLRHHLSWGDVPTWLLALTTLAALGAASVAAVVAYAVLRIEGDREVRAAQERAERRETDRRAQAARVAAWYGSWQTVIYASGKPIPGAGDVLASGAVIGNTSGLPVYDVLVWFYMPTGPERGLSPQDARGVGAERRDVVPPGETHVYVPQLFKDLESAGSGGAQPRWLVAIEFTDAAGVRWRRDRLSRLSPA
jgi:hypothetical protein